MQEFIRDQQSWQNVSLINENHFLQEQVFHSSPLVYDIKKILSTITMSHNLTLLFVLNG